jgi:hypothetical protein
VHYTDHPPSDSALPVPGTGTRIDIWQAIKELSAKEQEFKQRQDEANKAKEKAEMQAEQARIRRQNCENARNKVKQLQGRLRLYTTTPSGAKVYMNELDRQQALNSAQQVVSEHCD